MAESTNKIICWTPRILSVIFVLFLALMSLDVFESAYSLWEIILGLFIHNIPTFILLLIVIISWKHEIVGGIAFIHAGAVYATIILIQMIRNGFEWYYLAWIIQISGVAFLIGILYIIGWKKKRTKLKDKKDLDETNHIKNK